MLVRPTGTTIVPGSRRAAAGRRAEDRLFVRAASHCIYSAFRGFCQSPAATREIFSTQPPPPPPPRCITWLLFSCCCFFPPAFVAVGCGRGQVTGQDVLLLRRYGHANKLHSFQELFQALEGDHLYRQVVSTAPDTALARATSSPPDPPALALPRAGIPTEISVSEAFDGTDGGCSHYRAALGTSSLHTLLRVSVFKLLWWLLSPCVAVTRLGHPRINLPLPVTPAALGAFLRTGQEMTPPHCSSLGEGADRVWVAMPSKGRWPSLPRLPPPGSLVPAFACIVVMLSELQKDLCIFLPPDLPPWGSRVVVTTPSGCSWVSSATLMGPGDPCTTTDTSR